MRFQSENSVFKFLWRDLSNELHFLRIKQNLKLGKKYVTNSVNIDWLHRSKVFSFRRSWTLYLDSIYLQIIINYVPIILGITYIKVSKLVTFWLKVIYFQLRLKLMSYIPLQYENEVKIGFWTKKALTRPGFSNASGEVWDFALMTSLLFNVTLFCFLPYLSHTVLLPYLFSRCAFWAYICYLLQ